MRSLKKLLWVGATLFNCGVAMAATLPADILDQSFADLSVENPAMQAEPLKYKGLIQQTWDEYGVSSGTPTAADVSNTVVNILKKKLVNFQAASELAQLNMINLMSRNSMADTTSLIMALHPYAVQAGFCRPIATDIEDVVCSYSFGDGLLTADAGIYDTDGSLLFKPGKADGLDLGLQLPQLSFQSPTDKTEMQLIMASASEAGQSGGAKTDSKFCSKSNQDFDCYVTYTYRYKNGWSSSKLWGEVVATAVLRFGAKEADTVTVNLPIVLRCDNACRLAAAIDCGKYALSLQCLAGKVTKENWVIHRSGSYIEHAQARTCGIRQARPTDRSYFNQWQAGNYDGTFEYPDDLRKLVSEADIRFRTSNQYPPVGNTATAGYSFFPVPTSYDPTAMFGGLPALPISNPLVTNNLESFATYRHSFSAINGWQFNVIFSAADALPTVGSVSQTGSACEVSYQHPSHSELKVRGNQFQVFHGTTGPDFPSWSIIVGWNSHRSLDQTALDQLPAIPGVPVVSTPTIPLNSVPAGGAMLMNAPLADADGVFTVNWTPANTSYPSAGVFSTWQLNGYTLEISRDAMFSAPQAIYVGAATQFRPSRLANGTYYFRVTARYVCRGGLLGTPSCGTDYPKSAYTGPNSTIVGGG